MQQTSEVLTNLYNYFINESKEMFLSFGIGVDDERYKSAIPKMGESAHRKVKIISAIETNKGCEIAFEGSGIMSGLNTFDYKIYSIDVANQVIRVERRKRTYCKNIYDILQGKENFVIRNAKTKEVIFNSTIN
jgi:hypothetical protein